MKIPLAQENAIITLSASKKGPSPKIQIDPDEVRECAFAIGEFEQCLRDKGPLRCAWKGSGTYSKCQNVMDQVTSLMKDALISREQGLNSEKKN
jgi:hypothetical protein